MSDPTQTSAATSSAKTATKSSTSKPIMVGVAGALVVAALVAGVAMKGGLLSDKGGSAATPSLSYVDLKEVDAASATLDPGAAGALVDDAKHCKIPLVSMTIEKGTAQIGSTLRIRSGSYVSPYFTVTEGMQRIAMPYPAPYGAGAGTFVVEGTATGSILGLTPTKVMVDLPTALSIPVVWHPGKPC